MIMLFIYGVEYKDELTENKPGTAALGDELPG